MVEYVLKKKIVDSSVSITNLLQYELKTTEPGDRRRSSFLFALQINSTNTFREYSYIDLLLSNHE